MIKTVLTSIAIIVFGKLVKDNLPSLHWRDLLRYTANFITYAKVALLITPLFVLYKLKMLPKQIEQTFAIMLGILIIGLAFSHALKSKSNKSLVA